MPVYPQSHSYRDIVGRTSWIRYFISATDLAAAALNADVLDQAVIDVSRAARGNSLGPLTRPPTVVTYGTNVSRQFTVQDKDLFIFETARGSRLTVRVPAPRDHYLADRETVDLTAASVAAFVTKWLSNGACLRDGSLITRVVGAYRIRTKSRRKAGLYLKNPQLTTTVL